MTRGRSYVGLQLHLGLSLTAAWEDRQSASGYISKDDCNSHTTTTLGSSVLEEERTANLDATPLAYAFLFRLPRGLRDASTTSSAYNMIAPAHELQTARSNYSDRLIHERGTGAP